MQKKKRNSKIINTHFLLNLNYNIEQILKNDDVIEIIENTLKTHELDNNFNYTITDEQGKLILTNFEDIDNVSLGKYSQFSSVFWKITFPAKRKHLHYTLKVLASQLLNPSHTYL